MTSRAREVLDGVLGLVVTLVAMATLWVVFALLVAPLSPAQSPESASGEAMGRGEGGRGGGWHQRPVAPGFRPR